MQKEIIEITWFHVEEGLPSLKDGIYLVKCDDGAVDFACIGMVAAGKEGFVDTYLSQPFPCPVVLWAISPFN